MKFNTRPIFSLTLSLLIAASFALTGSDHVEAQETQTQATLQQEEVVDTLFLPIALKSGFQSSSSGAYPAPEDPTAEPAPTSEPEPTGECDLTAEITDPSSSQLPGSQPQFWTLRFRNTGDGLCFDNGVELLRYRGSTGAGTPELIGSLQALPELAPGEETSLSYSDDETPRTGTFRYRIRYELPQSDANNENHQPEKVVTFVWDGGSGGNPPPPPPGNPEGPCDLKADFIAPQNNNRTGGQSFTFTVEFENIGDETCSGNNISLERFVGNTASGVATRIGGSGAFEQLPDLRGGRDTRLSWTENTAPQTGVYTYKIRYSSPHNDEDNFNHYPEKTITYSPQGGGGNQGQCDLEAVFTNPTTNTPIGGVQVNWQVRFRNLGNARCDANTITLERFSGNSASGVATRIGGSGAFRQLNALNPGLIQTLGWTELNTPNTGTYTYRIKYSSAHNDSNNNNHRPQKTVTYVPQGGGNQGQCDLQAQFTNPTTSSPIGGVQVNWQVRFRNLGDARCDANNITLERFNGNTASGVATRIGGSGAFRQLNALNPGQSQTLGWTELNTPNTGTYTYRIKYSSAHNDSNNNNHRPQKTVTYVPQNGGGGNQGDCDLQAQFTNPTTSSPIGGVQVNWQVRFRNLGDARCDANTITLERFSGNTASGVATRIGGSGAFRQLNALNPGQSQTLGWSEQNTPNTGTYTYRIKYSSAHNDSNNNNHRPQKTVTYVPQGGGGNQGDCDLQAQFTNPTTSSPIGGVQVNWQVRFRNLGNARCDANTITLERFSGNSASGVATRIGGSGAFRQLNALNPGQTQTLGWTEQNTPNTGTYTYRIKYSSAHNDDNNNNHRPQKTVTYVPQGGGGGGQGNCDIEATFTSPSGTTLQGGQNVKWEVRLRNRGNGSCSAGQLKLRRYVGQSASGPSELIGQTNYDALSPNQSKSFSWTRSSSSAGGWYTYTADLGNHRDSNNNNHKPRKTVRYRANGCDIGVEIRGPNQNSLNSGQNYTWQVRVTNLGNRQCSEGSVRLVRYSGNRPSGNSTLVGLADYPRLNQDQSRNISWTRQAPAQDGTYTWQIRREGGNDANGSNDRYDRTYNVR